MRLMGTRWLHTAVVVAFLALAAGTAISNVSAERASGASGFRALSGADAASFEVPTDARLVRTLRLPAYGLVYERYQQEFNSADVLGGQITVYRDDTGSIRTVVGAYYPGIVARNTVRLSSSQASAVADRDVGPPQEADQGHQGRVKLMIDPRDGRFFFQVTTGRGDAGNAAAPGEATGPIVVSRWIHWIDAENGQVLNKYDAVASDGYGTGAKGDTKDLDGTDNSNGQGADDLTTFHNASGHGATGPHYDLFSTDNRQKSYDARNGTMFAYYTTDNDNHWTNVTADRKSPGQPAMVDAQFYSNVADDYYLGRHSLNWLTFYSGFQSVAHYGRNYNNAFWNGTYTVFGDGDGTSFREFSGSLDVVAHENTHGVTDATSNLIYQDESGALNESFSDMMGNSAEFFAGEAGSTNCVSSSVGQGHAGCADWWVAEDVYLPTDTVPGFRNMADPREDGDPDHYSERQIGGSDNGGVHTNSGIPNHAYFLAVNGGKNAGCSDSTWRSPGSTHTHAVDCGINVSALGLAKAERIFFATFISLPSNATMSNARDGTVAKAKSLYPTEPATCASIVDAWQAVGVSGSQTCGSGPAAPTNLSAQDHPSDGGGAIDLSWTPSTSAGITQQRLYRSTSNGGPYSLVHTFNDNTTTQYSDSGLTNGTTYYYVIRAYNGTQESGNSNQASAVPVDNTAPAAPGGLAASAGNAQVSLDWNNNTEPDFAGYNVYRSTTSGTGYGKVNGSLVGGSAYTDSGLVNGTTYYYVVTAVDAWGNESVFSNQASATPQPSSTTTIHVSDITLSLQRKGQMWEATAVVTIVDQSGAPVSDATVGVAWSLNSAQFKTDSRVTGSAGTVTFRSGRVGSTGDNISITAVSVAKAGTSYDPGLNVETADSISVP